MTETEDYLHDDIPTLDARYLQITHPLDSIIFTDMYESIIQGTWAFILTASQRYQFLFYNSSANDLDEIHYDIFSEAGSKTLAILARVKSDSPIIDIYIDDVLQGSIDLYSSVDTHNILKTLSITTLTTGKHTLKIKINGKNASSTNHISRLTWFRIL